MQPRVLIGLGAAALALATYALVMRSPDPREPTAPEVATVAGPRPTGAPRSLDDEAVAGALQRVLAPPPEIDLKLPPAAARRAAEESFEGMMHTLEQLADADKRVPRARRDQLYRETNDVFTALSVQLDANDPADMQLLEDANIRMKAMLRELEISVPRRQAVLP